MLTRRNEQGSQNSYCTQFMLSAAYKWNIIKIRISLKRFQVGCQMLVRLALMPRTKCPSNQLENKNTKPKQNKKQKN